MPDGGARRPCRGLRRLRRDARRLQLLPQPALPEVSGASPSRVACRAPGRAAAGSLFPRRVHAAGADRRDRLPEQGRRLRDPVQGRGRGDDDARRQSALARRRDRRHRRAAHLGAGADPSSPRPLRRAGRRPFARWHALDRRAGRASFSPSNRCRACSAGSSSNAASRLRRRRLGFFGDLALLAEPAAFARRIAAMRRVEWVVYAKPPFGGPAQVLAYLGRYTHRVAIANSRLRQHSTTIMSPSLEGLSP